MSADAPMELKISTKAAVADSEVEAAVPDLMCYFTKVYSHSEVLHTIRTRAIANHSDLRTESGCC